jgi:hypothetical protein
MQLSMDNAVDMSLEPEAEGADRRRGLRVRQSRPIKVYEPTSCRFVGGQTEDVSVTGLRIQMPRSAALLPGATVSVHVGLDGAGQPLANRRQMMPARVVWVDRSADLRGTTLWAGIEWVASLAAHLNAA